MKILLIAYNYPPIIGPESIQANRLIKYISDAGMDCDVLTRCEGIGKKFSNKVLTAGNVVRSFSLDNYLLKAFLYIIKPDYLNFPDAEIFWYPFGKSKANKLITMNEYDWVYSRSVPFTSHLIALEMKKIYGIKWVAHFSDPWTDSPYINYRSKKTLEKNLYWEKQVLENADRLIFTSQETIDLILKKYNDKYREKSFVLPHTYEPEMIEKYKVKKNNNDKTVISYIGNFYTKRTPEDFFKSIRLALDAKQTISDNIEINIFGKMYNRYINMIKEMSIDKIVNYKGIVSYEESQREIGKSDVLINIDAPGETSVFLPSKIIEYIAYEKPIISLTPSDGTVAKLLGENGHIIIENSNHHQLRDVLIKISEEGTDWIKYNNNLFNSFDPRVIANEFLKIINL